ncbi:hypothetical protein Gohar_016863 [Gossypium harknessii]|uniref:Transmembrane protein n=1 Tax=Gossypium harknessii TaxID=34285 RepID=A0A7J9G4R8_9ROSI|nr:hypothetical protein [Gossypium harknessii]
MADQSSNPSIILPKPPHPLHQIAETPTHRLLLKQWLKEEELILNRISFKETQIDSVRKEITQLYIFFFLFHSISLLLLFNSSSRDSPVGACHRSWIPSLCSLLCSMGIIWAVRYKTDAEGHLEKLLEREKEDGKLLGKCVEELKKKGVEFDLLKEVDALRRAKSLRVEAKAVRKWSARDFVTLFFFTASCLVLGLTRLAEKIDVGFCHRKGRKLVFGNGIGSSCRIFSSAFDVALQFDLPMDGPAVMGSTVVLGKEDL